VYKYYVGLWPTAD